MSTDTLRAAAELVRFAKTAPGRLPSAVQDVIATIEAALAAEQPQPFGLHEYALRLLVAAGHVEQSQADEAVNIARRYVPPPPAAAPAEQPKPEPSARVAPVRDSRCDYVTPAGKPCRKCGRVHDGGRRFKPYGV